MMNPTKFSEYITPRSGGVVQYIRNLISKNLHSSHNVILLTGNSGSGKTTLANLYSRSTLCPNRPEGTSEGCGICSICIGEDKSNITSYTITNTTEARTYINSLIDISNSLPIRFTDREDQLRRFIILDEAELASAELIAQLLGPLENLPPTTTWLILSMDLAKLEKRDPVICEALKSRCIHLPLGRIALDLMVDKVLSVYPDIDRDVVEGIVKLSGGNMRSCWSDLSRLINTLDKPLVDISMDDYSEVFMGGLRSRDLDQLWYKLGTSDSRGVINLVKEWCNNSDPRVVASMIEEDLISNMKGYDKSRLGLLSDIGRWYTSGVIYPLYSVLLCHLGMSTPGFFTSSWDDLCG